MDIKCQKHYFLLYLVTLALIFNPLNPVHTVYYSSIYQFSVTGANIIDVKDYATAPVE